MAVLLLAPLLLAATPQSSSVLVVDVSGAGAFTQIQQAVDAASDGDTLLVRSGTYASFVVPNKGLAIIGDTGASVAVQGAIRARYLATGKTLLLQNLQSRGEYSPAGYGRYGLFLNQMAGAVRVERCTLEGASGVVCGQTVALMTGWTGARVDSCGDVAFSQCVMRGGRSAADGNYGQGLGGEGLRAESSVVTLHGCEIIGGRGTVCCEGSHGGHGAVLRGPSFLFAARTSVRGGDGADAQSCPCAYGGNAGWGLLLYDTSQAWLAWPTLAAGRFGYGILFMGCLGDDINGWAGQPSLVGFWASLTNITFGTPATISAPSPVREGATATMTITGGSGSRVYLLMCPAAGYRFEPSWRSVLLAACTPAQGRMLVGTIPPSGTLSVAVPVPALALGDETDVLHVQCFQLSTQGHWSASNATWMVVVGQSF